MKCPKCGSENTYPNLGAEPSELYFCRNCKRDWTVWQMEFIWSLQAILREIAELPNTDTCHLEPDKDPIWSTGFWHGLLKAAQVAAKGLKEKRV